MGKVQKRRGAHQFLDKAVKKTCIAIGHELNIELVEPRWAPSSGVAVHHPPKFEYAVLIYAYNVKNVGSINESKSC